MASQYELSGLFEIGCKFINNLFKIAKSLWPHILEIVWFWDFSPILTHFWSFFAKILSKTKNNLTYAGIAVINPKIFIGLKEDYYDLWTDLLQKYVKQNEVTGEIYSGELINLNSKKEMNLLDALIVE